MDKAAGYLGIARKAGYLEIGTEKCGAAVRSGKAKLLLLASDASDNTRRRAEGFISGRKTPLAVLPGDKEKLSGITGTPNCAMLALTDIGLASSFAAALADREPRYAALSAALAEKEKRARARRQEAGRHERNLRTGKGRT